MKNFALLVVFLGVSGSAFAGTAVVAPEIDAATAVSAVALVTGGLFVLRNRKK